MLKKAIHPITPNIWFRDATPKLLRNFRYLDTLEQYKEFAAKEIKKPKSSIANY